MSKSRPQTYLGNTQGDHVTPYGLIEAATKIYSELFLNVDREIMGLGPDDTRAPELEKKKQDYRNNLIQIFLAVSIFNKDVVDFSDGDGSGVLSSLDEEDNSKESGEAPESSFSDEPTSKRRRKNLESVARDVVNIFNSYKDSAERYVRMNNLMGEGEVSFPNDDEGEKKVFYINETKALNDGAFTRAKEEFCEKLQEQILTSFNNIEGITYIYQQGLAAKDLIKQERYFDFHVLGARSGGELGAFGDAPFVKPLITLLRSELQRLEKRNLPYLEKECEGEVGEELPVANTRRSSRVPYINAISGEQSLLISKFLNSFFLPGPTNTAAQSHASSVAQPGQNFCGKLGHHLARHIFLIEKCFPFLTNMEFPSGETPRKKIDFAAFVNEIAEAQMQKYDSQAMSAKDKKNFTSLVGYRLGEFSEKIKEWGHGLEIKPTPSLKKKITIPKDRCSEEELGDRLLEQSAVEECKGSPNSNKGDSTKSFAGLYSSPINDGELDNKSGSFPRTVASLVSSSTSLDSSPIKSPNSNKGDSTESVTSLVSSSTVSDSSQIKPPNSKMGGASHGLSNSVSKQLFPQSPDSRGVKS